MRILSFIVLIAVLVFTAYDVKSYQSRKDGINSLLLAASQDEINPPPVVTQLVKETVNGKITWQATRLLIEKFGINSNVRTLQQHANSLIWYSLVSLHLSEQEQMTVFLSQVYTGIEKRGLSAASESMFHKPLSSLSLEQIATLAIITKGPSYYAKKPESLEKARASLLSRISNGS